MLIQKSIAD